MNKKLVKTLREAAKKFSVEEEGKTGEKRKHKK